MSDVDAAPFLSYLAEKRPAVEAWLKSHTWTAEDDLEAADLERYLYGPLARFNGSAGKRVRPVLVLLGCEAAGGEPEEALAAGCAIELFQSAALIHDDIADGSMLRRNEPCLHISEGLGIAINAGDAALVQACQAILNDSSLDDARRLRVLAEIVDMERRTLEGQALDLGWARDGRWDLCEDDYLAMATLKTAHYSAASPLAIGAACAGADEARTRALRSFGLKTGLAFQIADDLLNLTGDESAQGKDLRSDITEGKRTLAVLYTLSHLEGPSRETFLSLISSGSTDEAELLEAVGIMEEAGAIGYARAYAGRIVGEAIEELDSVELEPKAREALVSMAHFFIERDN